MNSAEEIKFEVIKTKLLNCFPELQSAVNEELEWWKGEFPGLHNFLGNVFNPMVTATLYSLQDQEKLEKIFLFIEELVLDEDYYISNVGEVTVCEGIVFNGPEYYNKALHYALPETKKCLEGLYKDFYIDKKDEMY